MLSLAIHLLQSSLCVLAAWVLALALRENRAAVRYWVWMAASAKFLVPFSLLVSAGGHWGLRAVSVGETGSLAIGAVKLARPFLAHVPAKSTVLPAYDWIPSVLLAVWFAGFAVSIFSWARCWQRFRSLERQSRPAGLNSPIPALLAPGRIEPGVFGIWRQVLLLPEGIGDFLPSGQLATIIAHESCHARRHDNLTAAIHSLVESVFWFYPPVHWIKTRLVAERERACDEDVLRRGGDAHAYAEGILNVCRFYLSAPPLCASAVTGADLRERIDAILADRAVHRLSPFRRFLLAGAAISALAIPWIVGMLTTPAGRAQSYPAAFDAVSIKPAAIPVNREGGNRSRIEYTPNSLSMWNVSVIECVQWAYGMAPYQISAPKISNESYDILAKSPGPVPVSQLRVMLRDVLTRRFQAVLHRETQVMPVYELVIAKGGPKLPNPNRGGPVHAAESLPRIRDDSFVFADVSMPEFSRMFAQLRGIELPIVDRTGIVGAYDIVLKSAPSVTREGNTAALFDILQEQTGLKLVQAKDPIEVIVIDRAQKPSEN